MANNFDKYSDSALFSKIGAMSSTLIENPTDYGLTLDQVEELQDANNAFNLAIDLALSTDQVKLSAYQAKFAQRAELLSILGSITKRVYGDPNVDDKALTNAGFAPRPGKPQFNTPNVPTNATATVAGPSEVLIKWNRNGNPSPTQFIVEQQTPTGWIQIASVTSSKFIHTGIVAGEPQTYRVYAQRGNRRSFNSNEAAIWSESEGSGLSLAA